MWFKCTGLLPNACLSVLQGRLRSPLGRPTPSTPDLRATHPGSSTSEAVQGGYAADSNVGGRTPSDTSSAGGPTPPALQPAAAIVSSEARAGMMPPLLQRTGTQCRNMHPAPDTSEAGILFGRVQVQMWWFRTLCRLVISRACGGGACAGHGQEAAPGGPAVAGGPHQRRGPRGHVQEASPAGPPVPVRPLCSRRVGR